MLNPLITAISLHVTLYLLNIQNDWMVTTGALFIIGLLNQDSPGAKQQIYERIEIEFRTTRRVEESEEESYVLLWHEL